MFLLSTDEYVEQGDADAPPMPVAEYEFAYPGGPPVAMFDLHATPNEDEKSLIVIDKNTAKVLEIRPWPDRRFGMNPGVQMDFTDCLKGRANNQDYIALYSDISADYSYAMGMEHEYLRGVFRISEIEGEPYLVYDGGEFDGQKVKLDNEGRVIRRPVRRLALSGKRKNSKRMKKRRASKKGGRK